MCGVQQICTFFVENQVFGVPVSQVQEVIRFQAITPVPLSPVVVEGVINLRGQIVIAIDLRRRLGLSPRASGDPMNVIVRTEQVL
jgi:purine-binding chemotaxis protein CheW